jgi:nucleoside-triphosphatase
MASSFVVLTGMPGCGKSTMVKRIVDELRASSITNLKGFYTEERRNAANERIGFDIKTFDGAEGVLARVASEIKSTSRPASMDCKVGKYVVYVSEFERLCMKFFDSIDGGSLLIIDEIGKMELFSKDFENAIKNLLISKRNLKILTTVPLKSPHKLIDQIKTHRNTTLFYLTKSNRHEMYPEIFNKVKGMM